MNLFSKLSFKHVYFIACAIYAFLILTNTQYLSPLEDIGLTEMFARNHWYGIAPVRLIEGRFNVLLGLDVYLLHQLHERFSIVNTSYNVSLFYAFIALSFLLTVYAAHKLIQRVCTDKAAQFAYLFLILLIFSPIFVYTNFRLLYTERYLFLVFLLTILSLLKFEDHKSYGLVALITLLANLGIHLKEVAFLSYFVLASYFIYRFFQDRRQNYKEGLLGLLIVISCSVYVLLYLKYIRPLTGERYGVTDVSVLKMFAINIYRWLITQPVLVLIFLPLFLNNTSTIFLRRDPVNLKDAIGTAGIAFMFGYLLLNINPNEYYLAPVYAIAVYYIFSELTIERIKRSRFLKGGMIICLLIHINSIQFGMNDIVFQKYNIRNFYKMVDEVDQVMSMESEKDAAALHNIYIADCLFFKRSGVMLYPFMEVVQYVSENANYEFLPYCDFELPYLDDRERFLDSVENNSPMKGDYIMYTPFSQIDHDKFEASNLKLVAELPAPSFFQNVNLPFLIKKKVLGKDVIKNELAYSGKYALFQLQ